MSANDAKRAKPAVIQQRFLDLFETDFYDDFLGEVWIREAVWDKCNVTRHNYQNPLVNNDTWDGIWEFFTTEYTKVPGKFELLAQLGIHGIPDLKALYQAKKAKHLANLKKLKLAYHHSDQDSKAVKIAKAARDPRLSFLDPIHCKKIEFLIDSIDMYEMPDLTRAKERAKSRSAAAGQPSEEVRQSVAAAEEPPQQVLPLIQFFICCLF